MRWVLWSYERALRDTRWAVLLAALFALAVTEGGVYPVPLMLTALALDALARLRNAEERRGLAAAGAVFAVLFPLLAAVKLVPVLRFLSAIPRLTPLDDSMTISEVLQAWTTRDHPREFPGHVFVWPEYNAYVGVLPVLLLLAAAVAAVVQRGEQARRLRLRLWVIAGLVWCAFRSARIPGARHRYLPVLRRVRVAHLWRALDGGTAGTAGVGERRHGGPAALEPQLARVPGSALAAGDPGRGSELRPRLARVRG